GIGGGEPLYVIRLDASKAEVIVGPREALRQDEINLTDVNWLGDKPLSDEPQKIFARIRSTRLPVEATLRLGGQGAVLAMAEGEFGVSPGQAAVFYEGQGAGQRVLGGGFIALYNQRMQFTRSAKVLQSA
ncbi:MAG: aminomethyltransferase beta-barrel domain-containing protein, partial [Aestuariivirga sp.]